MKRLVIGIDIDGVIVDFGSAILPVLSKVCDRPVLYQDLCSIDLGKTLNIDEKAMAQTWQQILGSDLLSHASPIKGAIEGLSALSGHEIWLVTSRLVSSRTLTLSWLRENRVNYNHIEFGRHGDKSSVGPKFDVFIEDFAEEASALAKAGIFTILFNQPWNTASNLPENCKRVYDWDGILALIDSFGGKER
jgi:uncharacterized HAD superfamily protein